jgi:hypothetical protein
MACVAYVNRDAPNLLNTTRWIEGHITEERCRVNAVQEHQGLSTGREIQLLNVESRGERERKSSGDS